MQHLDEGTIHAWLDGELSPAERAAAELHAASCAACAATVAEARGFIAASSRILTALDAVPGGVLPNAEHAPGAPGDSHALRRFIVPRAWMAVAAVLVLGIGTVIATRPRSQDAALRVAEEREQAKPAAMAPNAGPAATDSVGTTNESSAPAVAAESRRQKSVNKRSGFEAARRRKDASAAVNDSTPLMARAGRRASCSRAEPPGMRPHRRRSRSERGR